MPETGASVSAAAIADGSADAGGGAGPGGGAGTATGPGVDASPAAVAASIADSGALASFGPSTTIDNYTCAVVKRGGPFRSFLATGDTRLAFVDGDDGLALVNRSPTGALRPDYAPTDLVDVKDGTLRKPAECESAHECLRRDAAGALHRMLDAMRADGIEGRVQSAFRGFTTQCWVFASWAHQARAGFCEATEQSALPGHSQHQLGTTLDLFTAEWAQQGARVGEGVFRNGFGCTTGGKWLDDNAWRYGFVVPYPIHPDDRRDGSRCLARPGAVPINPKTGYKSEPWHVRYIGQEEAREYHDAWLASHPGSPDEITLEQWLRARRGLAGDAELPVCDGCHCSACATLATDDEKTPCGAASLRLDASGRPESPAEAPRIVEAHAASQAGVLRVDVLIEVPVHTPTQTPVVDGESPPYSATATFESRAPWPGLAARGYPDLPDAWRLAVDTVPPQATRWPWRVSLASPELAATWNRANLILPARAGRHHFVVPVAGVPDRAALSVTLMRNGVEHARAAVSGP